MKRRITSILLVLCMVLGMLPTIAAAAEDTDVANVIRYLDADGSEKFATDVAPVTSTTTTIADGWYVVQGSVQLAEKLTVSGTVHLILCDKATLTTPGVLLAKGNSLTIYAQSREYDRMGSLISETDALGQAGIGGYKGGSGTLVINGGNISAQTTKSFSAGIGCGSSSAYASAYSCDPITINGGVVTAASNNNAAAIGGSMNSPGCTVVVNGGIVTATGSRNGSGIGGGRAGGGGNFTQNGGIVLAACGHSDISHHAIPIGNGANSTAKGTATYNGGITFLSGVGKLNTNSFTLDQRFNLPADATLTVESGKTLTVAESGYIANSGTLVNDGTIVNNGGILNEGTFTNNGSGSCGLYAKEHPMVSDVCILCGSTNAPNLSGGVYYVSTANHLFWLAEQINGGTVTTPVHIELVNDITIPTDRPWTPILISDGKGSSFEGNGHTITMEIADERATTGDFGLFSSLNYSSVRNLVLSGSVTGNSTASVGAIAASAYRTTFENIVSFATVSNSCTTGGYAGGIVGYFGGKHDSANGLYSKLVNCAVYANVSGYNAGGIIGHGWNGTQYYDMTNCLYVGNVTANGGTAGAIVGYQETDSNTCTFTNVFWNETDGLSFYGKRDTANQVYNNTSARTLAEFASGAITWELNNGVTNGSQVWYQKLETDAYPLLSGSTVYYGYSHICTDTEPVYSNAANYLQDSPADHTYSTDCDTTCKYCDYVRTAPAEHTAEKLNDAEQHWQHCTVCDATWGHSEHSMKYETSGVNIHRYYCTVCGYIAKNEFHEWVHEDLGDGNHKIICRYCQAVSVESEPHTIVTSDTGEGSHITHCETCPYTEANSFPHTMVYVDLENGTHKHYCTGCNYVEKITGHDIIAVDNGDGTHTAKCAYCTEFDSPEAHIFEYDVCCICGFVEPTEPAQVEGIYQISNVGELVWFAQLVNSGTTDASAELIADIMVNRHIASESETFRLAYWTPLGAETGFSGSFDGNGHTISGLFMKGSDAALGFIGNLNGGTVSNLGIINSYFETDANNSCVGGVVATNKGTVSRCWFDGNLLIHGADIYCGGVVGANEGNVTNCYSIGSLSGNSYVGGVAGYNAGNGKISNCYYDDTVYAGTATGKNLGVVEQTVGKPTERFVSGEVAYLLNGDQSSLVFKQTVGADTTPNFTGKPVYRVINCKDETGYSNTNKNGHIQYGDTCIVCGAVEVATVTIGGVEERFLTLKEAFAAAGSSAQVKLLRDADEAVAVNADAHLDLNSYDLTGALTIAENKTLYVKDTQTDDYYVEDRLGYGRLTSVSGAVVAADGYLMITEADGTSFHRLNLDAAAVTLRSHNAGIYFQNQFGGDEVIRRNIVAYGTALGANKLPDFDEKTFTRIDDLTTWKVGIEVDGNSRNLKNGTILVDIMKPGNGYSLNAYNSQVLIYSQAYVELPDGTRILGNVVSYSLREVLEGSKQLAGVNGIWDSLQNYEKGWVLEMYKTYENVMKTWNIPNIKADAEKTDPSDGAPGL